MPEPEAPSMEEASPAGTAFRVLLYLRRSLLEIAVSFAAATAVLYWFAPRILGMLQAHFGQRLVFFGVMEPVLALFKLAATLAFALIAPWILWRVSQALVAVFRLSKRFTLGFLAAGLLLFYAGTAFCFFVTLPFGINFLLGYQSEHLRPVIAVGKFVDFVSLFLLSFGVIFELPLVMTLLCRLRVCSYKAFRKYRRYAVLVIAVMAAMLTPTPDLVNMSLMGVPLYLLYELGILVARLATPGGCP